MMNTLVGIGDQDRYIERAGGDSGDHSMGCDSIVSVCDHCSPDMVRGKRQAIVGLVIVGRR